MRTFSSGWLLIGTLTALGSGCPIVIQEAHAGEFRFMIEDLPDGNAAWLPSHVIIHQQADLKGGLIFILENPTARTHVFLVEGLQEQVIEGKSAGNARPLRVTIAPGETVRAMVSTEQFQELRAEPDREFRFFCPLHRGDGDPGGTIRIIHHGGTIRLVQ